MLTQKYVHVHTMGHVGSSALVEWKVDEPCESFESLPTISELDEDENCRWFPEDEVGLNENFADVTYPATNARSPYGDNHFDPNENFDNENFDHRNSDHAHKESDSVHPKVPMRVESLKDIRDNLDRSVMSKEICESIDSEGNLIYFSLHTHPLPLVKFSLMIDHELTFRMACDGVPVSNKELSTFQIACVDMCVSQCVISEDHSSKIRFACEVGGLLQFLKDYSSLGGGVGQRQVGVYYGSLLVEYASSVSFTRDAKVRIGVGVKWVHLQIQVGTLLFGAILQTKRNPKKFFDFVHFWKTAGIFCTPNFCEHHQFPGISLY